jgi:hypothetical protein
MGGKIDSMKLSKNQAGIELAMFHQMLIFETRIDFVLRSPSALPPPLQIGFSQGIHSEESIPGVLLQMHVQ